MSAYLSKFTAKVRINDDIMAKESRFFLFLLHIYGFYHTRCRFIHHREAVGISMDFDMIHARYRIDPCMCP